MKTLRSATASVMVPIVLALWLTGIQANAEQPASIKSLLPKAEAGDAESQFLLGAMYDGGDRSIKPDPEKALLWYNRAAARGHANAQFTLAQKYEFGSGIATNLAEAAKWYEKVLLQKRSDPELIAAAKMGAQRCKIRQAHPENAQEHIENAMVSNMDAAMTGGFLVSGFVVDENNVPLMNVILTVSATRPTFAGELKGGSPKPEYSRQTLADGRFNVKKTCSELELTFEKDGYEAITQDYELPDIEGVSEEEMYAPGFKRTGVVKQNVRIVLKKAPQ